jgi:TM2 domain-containing membrane protein YozV
MRLLISLFCLIALTVPLLAVEEPIASRRDSVDERSSSDFWTERKILSVVFSSLIPGSGQTYLGHTEKGAAFTLTTVASALMAGLSENNIVGRNERLEELKAQYSIATTYIGADTIWSKITNTKDLLNKDIKRRDLFLKVAVGLWIANVVDILFFTDDRGERPFGLWNTPRSTFAILPDPRNGLNATLTIRF